MSNQAQGLVRGLDMKAPHKPILMAYANYADDLGYVWAGVETIAFDTGYGITAVKDSRKTLIGDGWMASKRRFGTSSIVRLNLDLMTHKQVDRGDHWKNRPELEFSDKNRRSETNSRQAANRKTAGQRQSAATRPNVDPDPSDEQPPGGYLDSRDTAEYSAATRPLSVSDTSDDPSVRSARETDGRTISPKNINPDTLVEAERIVASLDLRKIGPTRKQLRDITDAIARALGGLPASVVAEHARSKAAEAKTVKYFLAGFADDHLPAPVASSGPTAAQRVDAMARQGETGAREACRVLGLPDWREPDRGDQDARTYLLETKPKAAASFVEAHRAELIAALA